MDSQANAIPPLSVTELTAGIKQLLEQSFAHVRVVGEVSRLTRHASGHLYFTIKDRHAAISAVIWRSTAVRLRELPEEGAEFVFNGHLSVYEPRGNYQLIVQSVEAAGSGRLAAEFERRKQAFAARGWFDAARKRVLPPLPQHIGIITSPSTAAIEDVKKVLATRPAWLQLTLSPSLVQGDAAPASIAAAFARMARMSARPDLILLVRGGGSVEDLWCFNDEQVVQAIVDSPVPVITGIGHEIDVTLADFAADARAATPSNAAELACPARETLRQRLPRLPLLRGLLDKVVSHAAEQHAGQRARLGHAWRLSSDARHLHIERLDSRCRDALRLRLRTGRTTLAAGLRRLEPLEPHRQLRRQRQYLTQLRHRLGQGMASELVSARQHVRQMQLPITLGVSRAIAMQRRALDHGQQRLENRAGGMLDGQRRQVQERLPRLERAMRKRVDAGRQRLGRTEAQLHALDPMHVLRRGYTLATTPDGLILHSIAQLSVDSDIAVRFHDGTADARVTHTEETP
jgi:exodeoxyribonuclease VII large subunit